MLIFDENSYPILIESATSPIVATHMWVLDFSMMDFTLAHYLVTEELVCPGIELEIQGFRFIIPSHWNILVYDKDTQQLDVVDVEDTMGVQFTALVYGPKKVRHIGAPIKITNYFPEYKHATPSLNKHQMLCHPISPDTWINVSPSDSYNKYLKNAIVSDIIGDLK